MVFLNFIQKKFQRILDKKKDIAEKMYFDVFNYKFI